MRCWTKRTVLTTLYLIVLLFYLKTKLLSNVRTKIFNETDFLFKLLMIEISVFSTWFGLRKFGRLELGPRNDSSTKESGCSCNQRIYIKWGCLLYAILKYSFKQYFKFGSVSPFCIWQENSICDWVDSIQSGINGQYIPTPSPIRS